MTRPENNQVICVSSCLGKLFCSIFEPTTPRTCHVFQYTSQISNCVFLPNNCTADRVFTLRTLILDKYVYNHKEKIYARFVDFKTAFHSVCHVGLLHKLLQINVGGCFYNLIKSLISTPHAQSKLPKSKHDPSVMREVCGMQGCILSPLIFNLYINDLPSAFENTLSDLFVLPNGAKLNSFFLYR